MDSPSQYIQFWEIVSIFRIKYFIIQDSFLWHLLKAIVIIVFLFIHILFILYLLNLKTYNSCLSSLQNVFLMHIIRIQGIILYTQQQGYNRCQLQGFELQNLEFNISEIITQFIVGITEMVLMFFLCNKYGMPLDNSLKFS